MNRKELKKNAKQTLKKHYWILIVICLFSGFLGIEYGSSFSSVRYQVTGESTSNSGKYNQLISDLAANDKESAKAHVEQRKAEIKEESTNAYLGRNRGVFAMLLNNFSTGGFLLSIMEVINSVVHSVTGAGAILILLSMAGYTFVWLFVKETYKIVSRRFFMESRTYEKVPLQRILYPIQTGCWARMAWDMFVLFIYSSLWSLTVVGGIIKLYSYRLVPYIIAENPTVGANQAITLSRKMMNGHKWECFLADVSFWGWRLLDILTFGLAGIFYVNAYQSAFFSEYYAYVRQDGIEKEIPGIEVLCDKYLYQKAHHGILQQNYDDVEAVLFESDRDARRPGGVIGFLSEWFGIIPFESEQINRYEEEQSRQNQLSKGRDILEGRAYPGRLAPAPLKFKMNVTSDLTATRSYTILHLVLLFFIFSFVGWLWEVSLHLIADGAFVNRGVLHGPWLPIYGTGGTIILILLKKLRDRPALEFVSAVIVSGCVEYFVSWYLEMSHDGQKWWDYTGYFLNLNGRICAEGLLTFGLGGMAIVYLVAPLLDNQLKKINKKLLIVVAVTILVVYAGDQIYSGKHPNTGKGITDYTSKMEENNDDDWDSISICYGGAQGTEA